MASMKLACLVAIFSLASGAGMTAGSPVEKVVKLIEEMQKRLEQDQVTEQRIYDKFACWCETATGRKAAAIHMAHMKIQELGTEILELKGKVAVLSAEVAELLSNIADNEAEQKKGTAIRGTENGAYNAEKADLTAAIASLEMAIKVLSGAALLQGASGEFSRMQAVAALKGAIGALPSRVSLTSKQVAVIQKFSQPEGVEAANLESSGAAAPQSATVQGILKDMYDTMTTDLESLTLAEANSQRAFEDFIAVKTEELNHMHAEVKDKEEQKAENMQQLADSTQELDDVTKQMEADIEFFDQTKAACQAKHEEWTVRSAQRIEEIEGIKKALEILTSDEARALFGKAIKPGMETFLQLDSASDTSAPAMKAYNVLKEMARKGHSLRLAALAATVRAMGAGHFDKVIEEIDKMIQVCKDEEKDDMVQRDWCKEEYHQNAQEKAETKWLIKRNEAQITKLQASIDLLIENIEDTEKEIELTKEQMKKMTEERTDENEAFKNAKTDDEGAIKLLGMAVDALSGFYKKNDIKMLQEPEFAVDKFQAPDATFSDKGARKNESKGIISILTMLKEDLEAEVKNGIKDEAANQVEYEKQMGAAKKLLTSLEERKVNLESDKAKTEEKKEAEEGKLSENQENLAINEEYKKSITPDCDWMLNSFQERRDKRAAEVNGLTKAKEFLSGASLVQASAKPHVQEFEQIGFLHQQ